MSLLKQIDAEGHIVEDKAISLTEARQAAERAITAEVQRLEDAFAVIVQKTEARAKAAEEALASLQKQHDELVSRNAEVVRKLDVLKELKSKLDAL